MKKYYTLFILLALLNLSSIAQDEPRQPKQFYIGVFASPDLSSGMVAYPKAFDTYNYHYNISRYSYTFGIEALYQLNAHFALTLGIQLSDKGGKTKGIVFVDDSIYIPNINYTYSYKYLDIPLRLDYYFSRKKIAPFITTGVSTNIFLAHTTSGRSIDFGYIQSLTKSTQDFSAVNFQFQVGAGLDFMFKKSRLRIFPIFRVSINKPNLGVSPGYSNNDPVIPVYTPATKISGRLYSIGLGINYFFRLTKEKAKAAPNDMRDL